MNITKYTVQACCGTTAIIYKTDVSLSQDLLLKLVGLGFTEASHFTKAGILYANNMDFIVSRSIRL